MLHFIKGRLSMIIDGGVIIENGGLGYEVFVAGNSSVYLAREGDEVMLYLNMVVREDDISLYGFSAKEELILFKQLTTVSGVGSKAAMAVLSAMPVDEVKKAIVFEDAAMLTKANGIGKKTAQRIVLELKDKVGEVIQSDVTGASVTIETTDQRTEAINALISLGYSKNEAVSALNTIPYTDLTTEQYLKQALKKLF